MGHRLIRRIAVSLVVFSCLVPLPVQSAEPPDFTRGDEVTGKNPWALGPTGAHGIVWAERFDTNGSRQIYLTDVDPGSPAEGKLRKDDVVLGVYAWGRNPMGDIQRSVRFGNRVMLPTQRSDRWTNADLLKALTGKEAEDPGQLSRGENGQLRRELASEDQRRKRAEAEALLEQAVAAEKD